MSPHTILSLVHVFAVVPLLAVIAKTTWIPPLVVAAIGAFITVYHAYESYVKLRAGKAAWVNIIHAALVGPVLAYTGLARHLGDPPRWSSEVILMFAFAAAGYHTYYLIAAPK